MFHRLAVGMEERRKKILEPLLHGVHVATEPSSTADPKMKRSSDIREDLSTIIKEASDVAFAIFEGHGDGTTPKKQHDDKKSQRAKALGRCNTSDSSEKDDELIFIMDL